MQRREIKIFLILWYKYLFISNNLFKFVVQKQNNMATIILNNQNSKPVKVSSVDELNKFVEFAGGEECVLINTPFGWMSLLEFTQSNDLNEMF